MSYRKLSIWQLACQLVIDIHKMTLTKLPEFELYEEGGHLLNQSNQISLRAMAGEGTRLNLSAF